MRRLAQQVVTQMNLDYTITMVSGGESGKYEVVMWDRPRNSYFSVRFVWNESLSDEAIAQSIRAQLQQRNSSHSLLDRRPGRRRSAA